LQIRFRESITQMRWSARETARRNHLRNNWFWNSTRHLIQARIEARNYCSPEAYGSPQQPALVD
jgi:hypothetical protein